MRQRPFETGRPIRTSITKLLSLRLGLPGLLVGSKLNQTLQRCTLARPLPLAALHLHYEMGSLHGTPPEELPMRRVHGTILGYRGSQRLTELVRASTFGLMVARRV